jgi:hypothetical protein
MPAMRAQLEPIVHSARDFVQTALGPWGAAAWIDAYEGAIRSAAQAQLNVAQVVPFQPARAIVARSADLTRDLGAVQVSTARWILDV